METDVLDLLMRHELAIKQLYDVFATMFTTHRAFWEGIAVEEQRHADWLEKLQAGSNISKELLNQKLKPQPIKLSIDYVEGQITKAKGGKFTLLEALSAARDIESALLERQFSRISEITSQELKPVMMSLAAETEKHRKELVKEIEAQKSTINKTR